MFFLKSAFCRVYQTAFRIALPVLPYREPEIIDSSAKLGGILQKEKVKSVLIVTDRGIVANGLIGPVTEALEASGSSAEAASSEEGEASEPSSPEALSSPEDALPS